MNLFLKITLAVSLLFNAYFIYLDIESYKSKQLLDLVMKPKDISLADGSTALFKAIGQKQPALSAKKYYFISIWNTMCIPCIKEMPTLDSIASQVPRNDIGYLFVTENSDGWINRFLEKRNIRTRHFAFINDMNDYISAVFPATGNTIKGYPLQLIIDRQGTILYTEGIVSTQETAKKLSNKLASLP